MQHVPDNDALPLLGESLRIDTTSSKRRPRPLELTQSVQRPPSVRPLEDLGSVIYPAGISGPNPELNAGTKGGKFRYDRDFLLQFRPICKEKPESLRPLDAIGLESVDRLTLTPVGSGRSRQLSGTRVPSRQTPISGVPGASSGGQYQSMGQFTASPGKFGPISERLEAATNQSVFPNRASVPFHDPPNPSSPGGKSTHRTRTKRGKKNPDNKEVGGPTGPQAHEPVFGQPQTSIPPPTLDPVVPLQMSENRWDRKMFATTDPNSLEVVARKVKTLLNKLTMKRFDSISDQIIQWANRSENQKDGRTLIQVTHLIFEKAIDEATWSELYARLCRKMMEQISPQVRDEGIKNAKGKPIAGGQLFRTYLLNRCREESERGWPSQEADTAIKNANEQNDSTKVAPYSDKYYTAQKRRRQGLGFFEFVGELFKLQMLTMRIMHEYIKTLLGSVNDFEIGGEEIERLCKLMTAVGSLLDTQRDRAHMDVYFQRMKKLMLNPNVSPRMQFMLQDVLELRERKWVARVIMPQLVMKPYV